MPSFFHATSYRRVSQKQGSLADGLSGQPIRPSPSKTLPSTIGARPGVRAEDRRRCGTAP